MPVLRRMGLSLRRRIGRSMRLTRFLPLHLTDTPLSLTNVPLRPLRGLICITFVCALCVSLAGDSAAQSRRQRATPVPVPPRALPLPRKEMPAAPIPALPVETVQADVSTRRIAVTSSFSGTEIIIFGAVDNSRQASAEAGLYDVVVVVLGTPTRVVSRRKSPVGGLWINTDSMTFLSVPSYYAIASTRPLDEVASEDVLRATGIGFDHVPLVISEDDARRGSSEIKSYRDSVIRLKRRDRLYAIEEYSVAFIGRSLFRASLDLPANVMVGAFETRVFLFRNGELLSQYNARLNLEREGVEDVLHAYAFRFPLLYGLTVVSLAIGAGLLASTVLRRSPG